MTGPKHRAAAWLASQLVGAVETKPNGGAMVERFQRAVDGVAAGEPWCVGFVQHIARETDELFDLLAFKPWCNARQGLPATEWTIALWETAPPLLKRDAPDVGLVVVWRSLKEPAKGHCGIITAVTPEGDLLTVEGNTSPGFGDQREGDGVWAKHRDAGVVSGFDRLGFVSPWL